MKLRTFGMSQQQLDELASYGIRYDKRTTKQYLAEHSSPSQATEESILRLERLIGVVLPEAYRAFLLSTNGGIPTNDEHMTVAGRGDIPIQHFYAAMSKLESVSIEYVITHVYSDRYPSTCLPFACDPSGNLWLLGIKHNDLNQVYFWDHEREANDEAQPFRDNLIHVANSFEQFLVAIYRR